MNPYSPPLCAPEPDRWQASWITHPEWADPAPEAQPIALPVLGVSFPLDGPVLSARWLVAGLGVYHPYVNGIWVGAGELEPAHTDFRRRVAYASLDITGFLVPGVNTLRIDLGSGVADVAHIEGRYTKFVHRQAAPRAIAQLELSYADGRRSLVCTDGTWTAALGSTTTAHWYGGEDVDARRPAPSPQWPGRNSASRRSHPSLPDAAVAAMVPEAAVPAMVPDAAVPAMVLDDASSGPTLAPRCGPPIEVVDRITPVSVTAHGKTQVIDFGLNIAGRPRLTLTSGAGREIVFVPAEILTEDGLADQHTMGSPVWCRYTTGHGHQEFSPRFTYYGFRYLQVDGLPEEPGTWWIEAEVLRAANEQVGSFDSTDSALAGVHRLIDRSIQSNMFSVFTDCPHREKLGWLEQLRFCFDALRFGYDVHEHLLSVLDTVIEAQQEDGLIPSIAPEYVIFNTFPVLGDYSAFRDDPHWGGIIVHLPWLLYRTYGDPSALIRAWQPMLAYLAYLDSRRQPDGLLDHGLGDWVAIDESTPRGFVVSLGYRQLLLTAATIGATLGHPDQAERLRSQALDITAALGLRYRNPEDGLWGGPSQAAAALSLDAGLGSASDRAATLHRLIHGIDAGEPLTVGEIGLYSLIRVLERAGRDDWLYRLVSEPAGHGYGRFLARGDTALPETWDDRDGVASRNHFMLAAIDEWLTGRLAGIRQHPTSIGWRRLRIAPHPLPGVEQIEAEYRSPAGTVNTAWTRRDSVLHLHVAVPSGATAEIFVPARPGTAANAEGLAVRRVGGRQSLFTAGPGSWSFTSRLP